MSRTGAGVALVLYPQNRTATMVLRGCDADRDSNVDLTSIQESFVNFHEKCLDALIAPAHNQKRRKQLFPRVAKDLHKHVTYVEELHRKWKDVPPTLRALELRAEIQGIAGYTCSASMRCTVATNPNT